MNSGELCDLPVPGRSAVPHMKAGFELFGKALGALNPWGESLDTARGGFASAGARLGTGSRYINRFERALSISMLRDDIPRPVKHFGQRGTGALEETMKLSLSAVTPVLSESWMWLIPATEFWKAMCPMPVTASVIMV